MAADDPLQGLGVLVTRPAHQAEPLCEALAARGAIPVRFPVLGIAPPADPEAADRGLARLPETDLAIFTSPNAVTAALDRLGERGTAWPTGVKVAAVGRGSAAALEARGIPVDVVPAAGYDSEALLATPELRQVHGMRAMLVKGQGGRALLERTLRARGARLERVDVYQRIRPPLDTAVLDRGWDRDNVRVAVVTSVDGLDHLLAAAGPQRRSRLLATGLVVISPRMEAAAAERGFHGGVAVAPEPGQDGLVAGVEYWALRHGRQDHS